MDDQNIPGENSQQHPPATPPPNSQGVPNNQLPANIKAIIQEQIQQERREWEAERAAQDHTHSSRPRNPSHHEYSHYTDMEESYSNEEARRVHEQPIP
ncbi:hypothetical protein LIER_30669 [Lithospermum erythrorhizon]|uniref:Uncharacterized protein n=1 Tax=Lithospermum erythrorhizon TaxID=34254 RepID=A0AAV3RRN1_LITER